MFRITLYTLSSKATAEPTYAFIPARKPSIGKPLSTISSSGSATSTTSLAQNTEVTSFISDLHDISRKRTYAESNLGDEPVRKKKKIQVDEDHIIEYVGALQRLVKGKMKIDREVWDDFSYFWIQFLTIAGHGSFKRGIG